jgi:hypothetical protein
MRSLVDRRRKENVHTMTDYCYKLFLHGTRSFENELSVYYPLLTNRSQILCHVESEKRAEVTRTCESFSQLSPLRAHRTSACPPSADLNADTVSYVGGLYILSTHASQSADSSRGRVHHTHG